MRIAEAEERRPRSWRDHALTTVFSSPRTLRRARVLARLPMVELLCRAPGTLKQMKTAASAKM